MNRTISQMALAAILSLLLSEREAVSATPDAMTYVDLEGTPIQQPARQVEGKPTESVSDAANFAYHNNLCVTLAQLNRLDQAEAYCRLAMEQTSQQRLATLALSNLQTLSEFRIVERTQRSSDQIAKVLD